MWETVLNCVAAETKGRLWDPPCWVMEDSRHRRKAEVALMRALGVKALPTKNVCTLASLAGEALRHHPQNLVVTAAAASLLLAEILAVDCPEAYRASADKPGFAEAFWHSLCDAESRGYFPDGNLPETEGSQPPLEFTSLQKRLHLRLETESRCTPGQFLLRAIHELQKPECDYKVSSPLFLGPMLQRSALERAFIGQLVRRGNHVSVAAAQEVPLEDLLPREFVPSVHPLTTDSSPSPPPDRFFIRPSTPEAELDAVFAVIARWVAEGRFRYQDIRLVHPQAGDALPQILRAARRYRVPVKCSVGRELKDFPGVVSLRRLMSLFESGWDRANVLDLLRSRLLDVPVEEKSKVIKAVLQKPDPRTKPPWTGWVEMARNENANLLAESFGQLQALEGERKKQTGSTFASWIRKAARFVLERNHAHALEVFPEQVEEEPAWKALDAVLDDLGRCFPEPVPRHRLIAELDRAVALARYLPADHRLDAVEIVPGSRDDFLPVPAVIYVGLTSAVPSPDRHNPFFASPAAISYDEKLRQFRQIISNARNTLLLSCPRFDDDGDELAVSPFLEQVPPCTEQIPPSPLDKGGKAEEIPPYPPLLRGGEKVIGSELKQSPAEQIPPTPLNKGGHAAQCKESLAILADRCRNWSPSRLDKAIQCRYLHFAKNILALEPRADVLAEATTQMLLGSIAHNVLEEYLRAGLQGKSYNIEEEAQKKYSARTAIFDPHPELDRAGAELVRCLTEFAPQLQRLAAEFAPHDKHLEVVFGSNKSTEEFPALTFDYDGIRLQLQGMIDRLDCDGAGKALVVEYKYKKINGESRNDFFDEIMEGAQPQLPLYWLVAQEVMGLNPVALVQIYLRSRVMRVVRLPEGPVFPGEGTKGMEVLIVSPEEIQQMLAKAADMLKEKALSLKRGDLTAWPADFDRCGPGSCAYADLCRIQETRWSR
jgi:RecB family exonuclease